MSQSLFTYRRLCVVAGVVYFVWWVVVRYLLPEAFNPLGSRLGVCASFFLVLIASSKWEWARRHIASLYAFCATILTLHYYYLYSFNAADPNWLGGAYITVIAVGVTVEAPWALLVYSGAVLGGASYVATRDASVVSLPGTVTILFLINVVGYLRKRADREHLLREKAEAAKIAADTVNRARMLFLANVNHELRTPLAGILGFADLLSRAKLSHDEQLFVERIGANARTLLATVEQILALTSSEATPWKVNQEKVDLPQLVNRVADVARQKCGARGTMTVNVLFDGPAPEVTSDSGLIGYVLGNLLDNAVKFTEAGVIRVTVRQVAGMVPPAAEILVADPGVGIKREQWERVFDPFVQVQSGYDRELGGSGVGLTVARRLARMLGGDVVIQESEVGKGTTVRFFFPCEMVRGSEGTEPGAGS